MGAVGAPADVGPAPRRSLRPDVASLRRLRRGRHDGRGPGHHAQLGGTTTLGALSVPVAADLLEHAWVLAVVNIYVVLGYGEDTVANLTALGTRSRFELLCS